ncbi:MAG TPA: hypothetical protein VFB80_01135, partial [Pirellulaceae bacterium]|nr:hypothetical protein [Pirellulaceae bacterium]
EPAVPQPSRAPLIIERPAAPMAVEPPAAKEPTPDPPEPPPPPATPPSPPENATPELEAGWLTIVNPPDTGGPVHLTVEGVVYRLAPGEYCQVAAGGARRVAYHQGDDFGYARHDLARGTHAFEIGNTGWTLKPLTPAAARQLVEHCRLRTAERE